MKKLLLTILFVALLPFVCSAATYYLDPTSGDDSNNGGNCGTQSDFSDACKTMNYIIDTRGAQKPDTIIIANGTHDWGADQDGNQFWWSRWGVGDIGGSGYLTIRAETISYPRSVTIDGGESGNGYQPENNGNDTDIAIWLGDITSVKFQGIHFTRPGNARLAQSAATGPTNDIVFEDCSFSNNGSTYGPYDCEDSCGNPDPYDGNITFACIGFANDETGNTSPIIVRRCEFYNNGRAMYTDNGAGGWPRWDMDIYLDGDIIVENSIFRDKNSGYFIRLGSAEGGGTIAAYNNTFEGNPSTPNFRPPIIYYWADGDQYFANNIFTDLPTYLGAVVLMAGDLDLDAEAAGMHFINNYGDDNLTRYSYAYTGSNWGTNTGNSFTTSNDLDFEDAANNNFYIGSSSAALNVASATYAPADDFDGTIRPQDGLDDVGAYENIPGGSCSTANDEVIYDLDFNSDSSAYTDWICTKFTTTGRASVTEYMSRICDKDTGSGNITVSLWTHNGDNDKPNTSIAASQATLHTDNISTCSSGLQQHYITLGTPYEIDNATTYWVCRNESGAVSTRVSRDDSESGQRKCTSSDGSTWSCSDNQAYNFEVWGCDIDSPPEAPTATQVGVNF